MCSRLGTITAENRHSFGESTTKRMRDAARCEVNQGKKDKKPRARASEKELPALITR
jgi:hypothetical protein